MNARTTTKHVPLGRLLAIICCAIIAGCAQANESSTFGTTPFAALAGRAPAPSYRAVFDFTRLSGHYPQGPLAYENGKLFGVTSSGHLGCSKPPTNACGVIYSISTKGEGFVILHVFGNPGDGSGATGGLVDVNGTLYGTTDGGGVNGGGGTVFSIRTDGSGYKVLYSFSPPPRGHPAAGGWLPNGVTYLNGALYGTAYGGKCATCGIIYRVTLNGEKEILHRFGNNADGVTPFPLIAVNGRLYGTTRGGGAYGMGTAFSILPSGANYTVLHSFGNQNDANGPNAGLTYAHNTLYGVAAGGGTPCYQSFACPSIFSMTISGTSERKIYSFSKLSDGAVPSSAMTEQNGTLYGMTEGGGAHASNVSEGGVAFSIGLSGENFTVLHSFGSGLDGSSPYNEPLTGVNGTLYGTASQGGTHRGGRLFSIHP